MRSWLVATVVVGWLSSAGADPLQVTLGGEVGGGSVTLFGTRYGAIDAGVEVNGARWLSPQLGVGLRLGYATAVPLRDPHMDGLPLARDVPWLVEPQVLVRTVPTTLGPLRTGWLASAGLGAAWLRTQELCGTPSFDDHPPPPCTITKERSTALEGSLTGGGYLELSYLTLAVGLRASANTGGDRSTGLVANLGATF